MAVNATEQAITTVENLSVRQFAPGAYGGVIGGNSLGFLLPARRDLIPAWGTRECDVMLRTMHYSQHNTLWSGAAKIWIEKLLSTPYEISGGRNKTFQYQDLFFESDFGEGYDFMMYKFWTDYLTLNRGAFLEKVAYGTPDTPIQEGARILGLNHLDALRMYFTGNREYPYLYMSEWGGKLHKMHYTRVIHLAESPSPDTLLFGMGKSALYDAISVANAQILLGRYQNELLSDAPPPGIVIFNNVKPDEVDTAMKQFEYDRIRDGQNTYRAPLRMSSLNPAEPATVTFVPLASTPQDFDYQKYVQIHVNMLALALQLDPQDIWPLQGQALGTGQQSKILALKQSNKGSGYVLTRTERVWNSQLLPRDLTWKYKAPNSEADQLVAQSAQTWLAALEPVTYLNANEKRGIVAAQVPAIADEIMDEDGQVRLFDADPKEPTQAIIAPDNAELTAPPAATPPPSEQNATATDAVQTKDYGGTEAAFVKAMQNALTAMVDKTITSAMARVRVRGLLKSFGTDAMGDGLEYGGVARSDMSADDQQTIARLLLDNGQYVNNVVEEAYSETGLRGSPETRAPLWTKSLIAFYQAGVSSADANGLYIWNYGATEHCDDCQRLNGQVHRWKDWTASGWMPQSNRLECGGWNCECKLTKAKGVRAMGRF